MTFDELIRYKALHFKYVSDNQGLTDMAAEGRIEHTIPMKNVCAMITQELFDELSSTCALLDISKRAFIEGALIDALAKADEALKREGVYEMLEARSSHSEAA